MNANSPFPLWTLLGILLTCGTAVSILVPSEKQILERLLQDGKARRALETLRTISAHERAKDPANYEFIGLRLERQLLNPREKAKIVEQLERSLQSYQRYAFAESFLSEILELIPLLNDADAAFGRIARHFAEYPARAREAIMNRLVKVALAASKPQSAANIYEACSRTLPATAETVREIALLWRSAGQPAKALEVLEHFQKTTGPDLFAVSQSLGELQVDLLPELDRSSEAFDLIYNLVSSDTNRASLSKWLPQLEVTASTPEQQHQLLAEYRRLAQANLQDEPAWRSVGKSALMLDDLALAIEAYKRLTSLAPTNTSYSTNLARLYEWTDDPTNAFDLYLELARQKDVGALDRLIDLNPGLYRDLDILQILRRSDAAIQERYSLAFARLLTKQGEYEEADFFFEKYLQENCDDMEILEEYSQVLLHQYQYPKALDVLRHLVHFKPNDLAVGRQLGEVCFLLGDFEESFSVYQSLARRLNDPEALQKYATLARCLGRYGEFREALERELAVMKEPSPADFARFAYACEVSGAKEKRREALEDGLRKFPEDDGLRLQLAFLLAARKEYKQALSVLQRHRNLKTDLTALHLYLHSLAETRDYAGAEKFLRSGLDGKKLEAASIRDLLASIYEGNKNYQAAEKIHQRRYEQDPSDSVQALNYAGVLTKVGKLHKAQLVLKPLARHSSPQILKEVAQLYAEMGKYSEAEALQKRFLELAEKVSFQDWSYLGDIRFSAGDRSGASRAYQQALQAFGKGRSRGREEMGCKDL